MTRIKSKEDFMKKRSIPLSFFLTVITFGIYGIVWWFKVTEETIQELKYESIDSAPLMSMTFGIILHQSRINRLTVE